MALDKYRISLLLLYQRTASSIFSMPKGSNITIYLVIKISFMITIVGLKMAFLYQYKFSCCAISSSRCFTLYSVLNRTPSRLLCDAFSHVALNARKYYSYINI